MYVVCTMAAIPLHFGQHNCKNIKRMLMENLVLWMAHYHLSFTNVDAASIFKEVILIFHFCIALGDNLLDVFIVERIICFLFAILY